MFLLISSKNRMSVCSRCGTFIQQPSNMKRHQMSKRCKLLENACASGVLSSALNSTTTSTTTNNKNNNEIIDSIANDTYLDIDLNVLKVYPTGIIPDEIDSSTKKIKLLKRSVAKVLIENLAKFSERQAFLGSVSEKGFLLNGLGGTGKSVTLYCIAYDAVISGWVVIYIPKLSEILSVEESFGTTRLANIFRSCQLLIKYCSPIDNDKDYVMSVFKAVMTKQGVNLPPILFALDEWNSCFELKNDNFGLPVLTPSSWLTLFFRNVFIASFPNGIAVCATSSNWGAIPSGIFDNADRQELEKLLQPYSADELSAISKISTESFT